MVSNLGIIAYKLSNNLLESFSKKKFNDDISNFVSLIKESEILSKEYMIIKNIEQKFIKDDFSASRYIDDNILIFNNVKYGDLINEHKKLDKIPLPDITVNKYKEQLYESIHNLIVESTIKKGMKSIDKIHESFEFILNYLKTNNINEQVEPTNEIENDGVYISILTNVFNNKYSSINEDEKNILNSLINESNIELRENTFTTYINLTKNKINNLLDDNLIEKEYSDKLNESKNKLKHYSFNNDTYQNDIIKLFDLYSCI